MPHDESPASPLVDPEVLGDLAKNLSTDLVVLDARPGPQGRRAWLEGHLPGALWVDLETDLAAPAEDPRHGGRHPLPSLAAWRSRVGELGITPSTTVIVYDDSSAAMAAARVWWMLRAIGHQRVAVVDGGLRAALAAGVPLEAGEVTAPSRDPYPVDSWMLPVLSIEEVDARRRDPNWRLVDVRSAARFAGLVEPFDPVKGHIPGAVNLPYTDLLDAEGRFLPASQLAQLIQGAVGPVSAERTIAQCGSGVTACHFALASAAAGLEIPVLYIGSWSEWCRSGRPIATRSNDSGEP